MKLSLRLEQIASLVPKGALCADIGADHGLLISYLVKEGIILKGYASDNKKGPYLRLVQEIENNGLKDKIECALKDGLDDLPSYIDTLLICGMGGDLIASILEKGKAKLKNVSHLVLAPHGEEIKVRKKMSELGFKIIDEKIVYEDHYYEIMLFEKGDKEMDELDYEFGYFLRREKSSIFISKYREEFLKNESLLSLPLKEERKESLIKRNEIIKKIID